MSMEHCSNEYAPLLMSVFFLNYDRSLKAIKQFPIKPEDLQRQQAQLKTIVFSFKVSTALFNGIRPESGTYKRFFLIHSTDLKR